MRIVDDRIVVVRADEVCLVLDEVDSSVEAALYFSRIRSARMPIISPASFVFALAHRRKSLA